jgi:TPR repeat protein
MTDFFLATSEDGVRFKLKNDGTWEPDIEIQSRPVNTKNMDEGRRLFDLAEEYDNGSINVIKDEKRAFQLYQQSAELGYVTAFSRL